MFTNPENETKNYPNNFEFLDRQLQIASQEAKLLSQLTDYQFMLYILNNGNQTDMNYLIPNNKFKAYTITERCWRNQKISPKQRYSISNVFIYTLYHVKYSDALNASR